MEFAIEFPVRREMQLETSSLETVPTARPFSRQAELSIQQDKSPDIRGFIAFVFYVVAYSACAWEK